MNNKTNEFKSFFKNVGGNEGSKCRYPVRLDTYGCGCAHDCKYCYAKSLLDFRKLWNPLAPSVANVDKVKNVLDKIASGKNKVDVRSPPRRHDRLFPALRNVTPSDLPHN